MPRMSDIQLRLYTPKLTVDSNRRGSALQRTRLAPVSNRVDPSDGPDGRPGGRIPPPLTVTWVDGFSTGYGGGFLKGNHGLPHYFTTTLSPFGKSHSSDGCTGSMMPIHINDDDSWHERKLYLSDPRPSATTMLLDGAMQNGEVPGQGG